MINKTYIVLVAVIFSIVITIGCYGSITGTVVDAETGKPIEGAIVLVEWTKTKGVPGMSYTESAKVIEVVSDKDGKVEMSGNFNPFVNPPHVTVYKKSYVAWNNEYIFPDYSKRSDFKWENGCVLKLEHFKPGYSYDKHMSFIGGLIMSGPLDKKKNILEAIKWEENKAFEERRRNK